MNGPTWNGRPLWEGDTTSRLHFWARLADMMAFFLALQFPFVGFWNEPVRGLLMLPVALGFTYVVFVRGRIP